MKIMMTSGKPEYAIQNTKYKNRDTEHNTYTFVSTMAAAPVEPEYTMQNAKYITPNSEYTYLRMASAPAELEYTSVSHHHTS